MWLDWWISTFSTKQEIKIVIQGSQFTDRGPRTPRWCNSVSRLTKDGPDRQSPHSEAFSWYGNGHNIFSKHTHTHTKKIINCFRYLIWHCYCCFISQTTVTYLTFTEEYEGWEKKWQEEVFCFLFFFSLCTSRKKTKCWD